MPPGSCAGLGGGVSSLRWIACLSPGSLQPISAVRGPNRVLESCRYMYSYMPHPLGKTGCAKSQASVRQGQGRVLEAPDFCQGGLPACQHCQQPISAVRGPNRVLERCRYMYSCMPHPLGKTGFAKSRLFMRQGLGHVLEAPDFCQGGLPVSTASSLSQLSMVRTECWKDVGICIHACRTRWARRGVQNHGRSCGRAWDITILRVAFNP